MIIIEEEKIVYVINFKEGKLVVELSGDELVDYDCYMDIWYTPSEDHVYRYFLTGYKVKDSSKETVIKEIEKMYDWIEHAIELNHATVIDNKE